MKNLYTLIVLVNILCTGYSSKWIKISSASPAPAEIRLISSTVDNSVIRFSLTGFNLREVQTPQGLAYVVETGKATPVQISGAPDIPKLSASVVIPDIAEMSVRIVSSDYRDFTGIEIAPSKGSLLHNIDEATVPFQYGNEYSRDEFFPGTLNETHEPFILRDLRGQTVWVFPFQYNPVTKVLRVYYDLTISLSKSSENGLNPLVRKQQEIQVHAPFIPVYSKAFLNFRSVNYTPLTDYGNLLILCHGPFLDAMQPFVKWKNSIGIPTEIVDVAVAGATTEEIKSYITDYYHTNGLTFVLLVGDGPQIPSVLLPYGRSDNAYTFIDGDDHYADLFIGRFSAETVEHVQTQVQRTIDYERNPQFVTDDWYTTVVGIANDFPPTGDDGEYKYEHVRNLQTQLLGYTYTANPEFFDGSHGGNDSTGSPRPGDVSAAVNQGCGLVLYAGHGGAQAWGTSDFWNEDVEQLDNKGKLPFIWSVGCENGCYPNVTCFAETWLRATRDGQPTGAIAFLGSTILQSGTAAMEGQDVMVDILTGSDAENFNRTFAGISVSGCMAMIDAYGQMGQENADTWLLFGDPSITVRTANPFSMTVTHEPTLVPGATNLIVNCNVAGARATLTLSDTILATGLIMDQTVVLTFPSAVVNEDTVHLVVNAFNCLPYIKDIPVIQPIGTHIIYSGNLLNDPDGNNDHRMDYDETVFLSVSVKNAGGAVAENVNLTLTASDPWVTVLDSTENYGLIEPGDSKEVQNGFKLHTAWDISNQHPVLFTLSSSDGTNTWTDYFSLTAHAPVVQMGSYQVIDSTANNNGFLDPGETAAIQIRIDNNGSSGAANVTGQLISLSPWVTVFSPVSQAYGDIPGESGTSKIFTVYVDWQALQGQSVPFLFEINADHEIVSSGNFRLPIGRFPVLIVDLDWNKSSGLLMKSAVESLGLSADLVSDEIPETLTDYNAVFVCLGIYQTNHELTSTEGQKLADYLNAGGSLYIEGGQTWHADWPTAVRPMFNITGVGFGSGDLSTISGLQETFTRDMSFIYSGDNNSIDRIDALSPAFTIFENQSPEYFNAVAYDAGAYKTIGTSFEFGGLTEASFPSTRSFLMEQYLNFFGIQIPTFEANFMGYPTELMAGKSVQFTDFSTGGAVSRVWRFPGGSPDLSTEQNPIVTYITPGNYDVELIINKGFACDTLQKSGYIGVKSQVGIFSNPANTMCSVFPNPNDGRFMLTVTSSKGENVSLVVMNSLGLVVYSEGNIHLSQPVTVKIDLSDQPPGVYILYVRGNMSAVMRKVILK